MTNNSSNTECSKQCAAFRNAQRIQGINPPVGHVDGCPRLATKRTIDEHMSHIHDWVHKPELNVSACACGAKAAGVPLTKRTTGQCQCGGGDWAMSVQHFPDCPALYPLQRQPGDEKDALTRLVAHVREAFSLVGATQEGWEAAALDLISEAREEHKRARDSADVDFAGLSKTIASRQALPECNSAGGIVIRNEIESLRYDLAKTTEALLACQKRMGEVRQQAFKDMATELAEIDDPKDRDMYIVRALLG